MNIEERELVYCNELKKQINSDCKVYVYIEPNGFSYHAHIGIKTNDAYLRFSYIRLEYIHGIPIFVNKLLEQNKNYLSLIFRKRSAR